MVACSAPFNKEKKEEKERKRRDGAETSKNQRFLWGAAPAGVHLLISWNKFIPSTNSLRFRSSQIKTFICWLIHSHCSINWMFDLIYSCDWLIEKIKRVWVGGSVFAGATLIEWARELKWRRMEFFGMKCYRGRGAVPAHNPHQSTKQAAQHSLCFIYFPQIELLGLFDLACCGRKLNKYYNSMLKRKELIIRLPYHQINQVLLKYKFYL